MRDSLCHTGYHSTLSPTEDVFGAGVVLHGEGAACQPPRVPHSQEGMELSIGVAVVVVVAQHWNGMK